MCTKHSHMILLILYRRAGSGALSVIVCYCGVNLPWRFVIIKKTLFSLCRFWMTTIRVCLKGYVLATTRGWSLTPDTKKSGPADASENFGKGVFFRLLLLTFSTSQFFINTSTNNNHELTKATLVFRVANGWREISSFYVFMTYWYSIYCIPSTGTA